MRILNFGSLNVDNVFQVDTIALPGQTISSYGLSVNSGGKGLNQSIAAARAGAKVFHAGAIGKEDKVLLKDLLEESGVDVRFVNSNHQFSGRALIQCDKNGQNCIVLFGGANLEIKENFVDEVLSHFNREDVLLLQNEISCIDYIMRKAKQKGMRICFNPSPADEKIAEYPFEIIDMLILNELEGQALTGEKEENAILDQLLKQYPQMQIVLTLGEMGSVYADQEKRVKQSAYCVEAVDTTAAGDTFTGYFLSLFYTENKVKKALEYAAAASAIAVGINGAAKSIPDFARVKEFLQEQKKKEEISCAF